jgi:hypothetical protein
VCGYKNTEAMGWHLILELNNDLLVRKTVLQLVTLFDCWEINNSPLETLAQMIEQSSEH